MLNYGVTIRQLGRRPIATGLNNLLVVQRRAVSSLQDDKSKIINHDSIYVLSIPITTYKSYIYCNHKPSILDKSQKLKFPLVTKIETKVTGIAAKGWNSLSTSKKSYNVKITNFIKKLLNTIPYEENCLKSFPSQTAMIREINEESLDEVNKKLDSEGTASAVVLSQIDDLNIPHHQIKPIPLLHPSFQQPTTILNQLYNFRDNAHLKHFKYAVLCGVGIPLSLPFALVPVVPNVPGFYIAYRFYCHVKALLGVKHLNYLLEVEPKRELAASQEDPKVKLETITDEKAILDTKHLSFSAVHELDKIYRRGNIRNSLGEPVQEEERVIISEKIIDDLCSEFSMDYLKDDLLKALKQESARLSKNLKVDDAVE